MAYEKDVDLLKAQENVHFKLADGETNLYFRDLLLFGMEKSKSEQLAESFVQNMKLLQHLANRIENLAQSEKLKQQITLRN